MYLVLILKYSNVRVFSFHTLNTFKSIHCQHCRPPIQREIAILKHRKLSLQFFYSVEEAVEEAESG